VTVSRILAFPGAYRDSLLLLVGVLKGAVMVMARFRSADRGLAAALRQRAGASGRSLILAVGGIEPRKGSDTLMAAIAALRGSGRRPVLAVVGGHPFQDYREYRDRVLSSLPALGLRLDDDVVLLGTVLDDAALADRFRTAGWKVCARFTWARCAAGHQRIYAGLKSR
jgi:hypothetical protein